MLSSLRRLLDRQRRLQPIDLAVLASVRQQLEGDVLERWDRQVAAIGFVQRMPDGCEIEFCQLDGNEQDRRFRNEAPELRVAEVRFTADRRQLRCEVWCVRGDLFSIEYSDCALMRLVNRRMRKSAQACPPVCTLLADLQASSMAVAQAPLEAHA